MKKSNKANTPGMGRRDLLRMMGGCAAMSQTPILSTLLNLNLMRSASAAIDPLGDDYKAIVCVFLLGGIDSYNVLVPQNTQAYADYLAVRGTLGLPQSSLLNITDQTTGSLYGLNDRMPGIEELYTNGNLGFVANTGSLIEPTGDKDSYRNSRLPLGLFSHSDQQRHWQTSTPQSRTEITGWAGRMSDMLNDSVNKNDAISMNISLGGLNILQTGSGSAPYAVSTNGAILLNGYGMDFLPQTRILTETTDSLLGQTYSNLLKQTHSRLSRQAIDAAADYNNAANSPNGISDLTTTELAAVPGLGKQMLQIAKSIGAREALGQRRQIFFVGLGGWDNHTNLISNQNNRLPWVSEAFRLFHQATEELGVASDVVTYTASDFARTLTPNTNNGSDHAWGGNHIVMGGGINGGSIFGYYPDSLAPGNSLDLGRGRLIPTTSVDEYAAELAMWFGLDNDGTLEDILPNIRNFHSAGMPPPLGFFS
jgi:uncharacterized protein (DUF1501 family)